MSSSQASVRTFIRVVNDLIPRLKQSLPLFVILVILYELVKFIPSYIMKLIVDALFAAPDWTHIIVLGIGFFAALMVLLVLDAFNLLRIVKFSSREQKGLYAKLFDKLLRLPLGWHDKHHSGSIISSVTKTVHHTNQFLWFLNQEVVPIFIQMILTGIFLLVTDVRIGLIYVLVTPFIMYLIDKQFSSVQPYRVRYHEHFDDATREMSQSLANMSTVKDYTREAHEKKLHGKHLELFDEAHVARVRKDLPSMVFRETITNVLRVSCLLLAAWFVLDGSLSPGDLVFVFTLTEKAFINLYRLGRVYHFIGDSYEAFDKSRAILHSPETIPDTGKRRLGSDSIVFDHVSFGYGGSQALHDISVTIGNRQTTALVGPSGAGKTTLVKLLMRHYDVSSGVIRIGDVDIRSVPLAQLRQHFAFVSQHVELFDRTVRENIAYGNPQAKQAAIEQAARAAHAHKFILGLPQGYDTIIGERGVRLSGGQRQRLSIARALLSDAPVIIFDEATSSLDSESEQEIQRAIFGIRGKTLILIAHRLSTIKHADKIVVLQEGKVVEEGTHTDLLGKRGGLYRRMQTLQASGFLRK